MSEGNGALDRALADLRSLSGDIETCAVLGAEGELLASSHPAGVDRQRAQSMLAAICALVQRLARERGKRYASQVQVQTSVGHLLLVRLEGGGYLAATANPEARVGLVLYDMRNARAAVQEAVEEGGR